MGLRGSPLFQLGEPSHILMSKDSRGIWRSLQESVGKEAPCNHKTSKFSCSLKWKMLVILPLWRSDEFGDLQLCSAVSLSTWSWGCLPLPCPPAGPVPHKGTCHSYPRDCTVILSLAGDTVSPNQPPQAEGTKAEKQQQ